ncbi:MAG: acid phosphatase [Caulobacteraceae bacterium]|nr:acid phosphatase [Caulobacteraceae bacterium]
MRLPTVLIAAAAAAGAGLALAQTPAPPPIQGYLTPQTAPAITRIIPPPPAEGSPRQKQDLDIFLATRQMQGSSRWQLATDDVSYTIPYLLHAFSCAAGVGLTPENAPKTALLVRRVLRDSSITSNAAKDIFRRKRPYLYVEGPICVAKTADLAANMDYPSGHSTLSWATGLVLSELMPDRSTALLSRARGYGESRIVCGVHSMSAVEAGRTTAAATVAAEHGSAEFRADIEAVRAELAALRASGPRPDGDQCLVEATLTARPPY